MSQRERERLKVLHEVEHRHWTQVEAGRRWQKTDTRDARRLLDLLAKGDFPRIWVPTPAERNLRQLLLHRTKLVGMRTAVKNQLQALALNQGLRRKSKLWREQGRRELEGLRLGPWAGARRREDLLVRHDQLEARIGEWDRDQWSAFSRLLLSLLHQNGQLIYLQADTRKNSRG